MQLVMGTCFGNKEWPDRTDYGRRNLAVDLHIIALESECVERGFYCFSEV